MVAGRGEGIQERKRNRVYEIYVGSFSSVEKDVEVEREGDHSQVCRASQDTTSTIQEKEEESWRFSNLGIEENERRNEMKEGILLKGSLQLIY